MSVISKPNIANTNNAKPMQGQTIMPLVKMVLVQVICFCFAGVVVACSTKEERGKVHNAMLTRIDDYKTGRLTARPKDDAAKDNFTAGVQPLKLIDKRDGFIYVPVNYKPGRPAALAVMLHGAGGHAEHGLSLLKKYADDNNIILVAPASRAASWDIISGNLFGPDVILIDQALALIFARYAIDPARIAIGGFSDGASYALCLGLTNGDLFTHIMAFSPGFAHTIEKKGKPAVFISHGIKDRVLPIDPCSRRIVPQLQRQGLPVNYQEFDGAHEIPADISESAMEWFI